MKRLLYITLFICTCCLPAAAQDRFVSDQPFRSEMLGRDLPYAIILPAGYESEADRRYPVIYLTHGLGCVPDDWNDKYVQVEKTVCRLEKEGLGDFIYVFPTGFSSYYSNTYDGKFPYMDMFIEEFVPFIDGKYRTIADREHRATVGFSMGGFGAMVLPLKHPETFSISAPLSMSFRTDEQYLAEPLKWWNGQWGSIFGGTDQEGEARLTDYYKAHCPFYQFVPENHEELSKVKWFLHCGDDEEQLLIANDDLHVQMREYGYEHEYRVGDGGHTGRYWRQCLVDILPYIDAAFNGSSIRTAAEEAAVPAVLKEEGDGGTVLYLAHPGLDEALVDEIADIILSGDGSGALRIVRCNLEETSLEKVVDRWEKKHSYIDSQVLALGTAGREAYTLQGRFSRLYFDNADLLDDETLLRPHPAKFWFISQTDDGPYYKDMGGLYKACKKNGASFQYRVRDGIADPHKEIIQGIETIKPYIIY